MKTKWSEYVQESHQNMIKEMNTRDLGKLRADAAEYFIRDWINENTALRVIRRNDLHLHPDFPFQPEDPNESGYDLLSSTGLKIQAKYRQGDLHLETTRRNSKKNKNDSSSTGHVAYSANEFDVLVIVQPSKEVSDDCTKVEYLAIPTSALKRENSDFLVTRVDAKTHKKYKGKAKTVLENLGNSIDENQ